jgi:hypothetical protein
MATKSNASVSPVAAPLSKVHERLMVVRFSATRWHPRRFDRQASDEIAKLHGKENAAELGRFNKILVELDSLKPINQAISAAQSYHYARTRSWVDDGTRVLPAAFYFDYQKQMSESAAEIAALARKFERDEYGPQVEKARERLGGLFKVEDYPAAFEVESRFKIRAHFEPLPDTSRVDAWGLPIDEAAELKSDITQTHIEALERAQKETVDEVTLNARRFVEKLTKYKTGEIKALFATAITNLRESVVLVLDGMNITGDERLNKYAREIEKALRGLEVDQLKGEDPEARNLLTLKTREVELISKRFAGIFG